MLLKWRFVKDNRQWLFLVNLITWLKHFWSLRTFLIDFLKLKHARVNTILRSITNKYLIFERRFVSTTQILTFLLMCMERERESERERECRWRHIPYLSLISIHFSLTTSCLSPFPTPFFSDQYITQEEKYKSCLQAVACICHDFSF